MNLNPPSDAPLALALRAASTEVSPVSTAAWISEPGVAIVTGANGGVGRAVVAAVRAQGWSVVANDTSVLVR